MYSCSDCGREMKELFGCGYDHNRGLGRLRSAKGIDVKGICPGWWRNSDIVDDVATMRDFKSNLGHPQNIPNRLIEAMRYLDNQEIILQNTKWNEEMEKRK